jgi:hypothetical protein
MSTELLILVGFPFAFFFRRFNPGDSVADYCSLGAESAISPRGRSPGTACG